MLIYTTQINTIHNSYDARVILMHIPTKYYQIENTKRKKNIEKLINFV